MLNTAVIESMDFTDSGGGSIYDRQGQQQVDAKLLDIILVEDSFSDTMLTKIALDATCIPYRMAALRRGYQLTQYIRECKGQLPDLILLDLGLPDMDGFDVVKQLASQSPDMQKLPIVVLSAQKHVDFSKYGNELNIISYISKPCDSKKMAELLSGLQQRQAS